MINDELDSEIAILIEEDIQRVGRQILLPVRSVDKIKELCKAHFRIKVEIALKLQAQGLRVSEYVNAANKAFE